MGVFARILLELAHLGQDRDAFMIDATHHKAHRTGSSLRVQRRAMATSAVASSATQKAG
jgi:hypothetical protein